MVCHGLGRFSRAIVTLTVAAANSAADGVPATWVVHGTTQASYSLVGVAQQTIILQLEYQVAVDVLIKFLGRGQR